VDADVGALVLVLSPPEFKRVIVGGAPSSSWVGLVILCCLAPMLRGEKMVWWVWSIVHVGQGDCMSASKVILDIPGDHAHLQC
jgi:hypothetical protein